jgi:hypothetical protein
MKPYGSKKNTRDKWKWGKKPHGKRCSVCNPPEKISVSKKRARREAKEEVEDGSIIQQERLDDLERRRDSDQEND